MFRRWVVLGFFSSLVMSAAADVVRLSEPVLSDATSETFGGELNSGLPRMGLGELVSSADQFLGQSVLIDTRVGKVCQKKGCFFLATEGRVAVRVSFKDYGFFIPTDSGNKQVTLEGQLIEKERSAEEVAHFNADINADTKDTDPALSAGSVYEIVADAVRIPRS